MTGPGEGEELNWPGLTYKEPAMSYIETRGGIPTRGEAYAKLMHHLDEAQNQALIISHLHNTEDSQTDKLFAKGWAGIAELMRLFKFKVTELAKGNLQ